MNERDYLESFTTDASEGDLAELWVAVEKWINS